MNRARDIDPDRRLARRGLAIGWTDDPSARRGIATDAVAFPHRTIHPPARRPACRDAITTPAEAPAAGAQA